jgi:hypothetical protein
MIFPICGIDPGPSQSAYAVWMTGQKVVSVSETLPNNSFLNLMRHGDFERYTVVIEDVAFYGKVLNKETFETLKMIGRLQEIFPNHILVTFPQKALHFCGRRNGVSSGQISQVMQANYGGKGTNKQPGPFHGVTSHIWDAVACSIWFMETNGGLS